ncbi:MAG TPA: hypothetical protein VGI79_03745 [Caulobacteraceae bacterium]|jgi:hypothetical protein
MTAAGAVVALALGAAPAPQSSVAASPPAAAASSAQSVAPAPDQKANAAPSSDALEPDTKPLTDDNAPTEPLADETQGSTVQSAYAAAEQRQGQLDGRWRLSDGAGVPLFDFQLTDPGGSRSPRASNPEHPDIEGAWRDLRREGGVGASGFLLSVRRDGTNLEIRFYETDPRRPSRLMLHPTADGGWTGELTEGGPAKFVFLDQSQP